MPFTHQDAEKAASKPADLAVEPQKTNKGQSYDEGAAARSPRNATSSSKDISKQEKERQRAAKEKYQALLGKWLGEKLYGLVDKELAPEKLLGHGKSGLDSALSSVVGLIDPVSGFSAMDEASEAQAVAKFAEALGTWAKDEAGKWLESEDGQKFLAKANHWVEGHPGWVVAAALAAAAGAVAANVDLPTIEQKFKLADGLSAKVGADLNKIRSIALNGASASLEYSRNGWTAAAGYSYKAGDTDTHKVSASVGHEGKEVSAGMTLQGDTLVVGTNAAWEGEAHKLSLGATQTREGGSTNTLGEVSLRLGDNDYNVTTKSTYDVGTGALGIDISSFEQATDKVALRTAVGSSEKDSYSSVGLDYKAGEAFALSLDYRLSELQGQNLSLTGRKSWEAGKNQYDLSGSGNINLDEVRFNEASLNFSWKDKEEFKGVALQLKHKYGDIPETTFNAIADATAGEVMFRVQNRLTMQTGSLASNVTQAHAAYEMNPNWTVFGGGKYGQQMDGFDNLHDNDRGGWVEAGVQYKQIPLKISVRPSDGAVSFGLTIPFGR